MRRNRHWWEGAFVLLAGKGGLHLQFTLCAVDNKINAAAAWQGLLGGQQGDFSRYGLHGRGQGAQILSDILLTNQE